ncbi:hypothetical protein B0T10DRAFT_490928 [Thelonectria olida]|uniref:chitin synthase n=1 Tax=Thelonectria olida TaxID=1576542 RepID=A0A9P8VZP4_9HYPO|nr:hypothetical protein B0T10DRAFT_490928 [Thelonectria olida]
MSDPLSIAAGCAGLISTIGTLSFKIHSFVRTCRDSRRDLDRVSRELQSLQSVLELIQEDAADEDKPLPPTIGQHISGVVSNCNSVVLEIQRCIAEYGDSRLRTKAAWAIVGHGDIEKLRMSLEAHKSALELALDLLALALTKEIKTDTTELRNDTAAIKDDTAQILEEIARLQSQLPHEAVAPNDFVLQKFLEEMTEYTEDAMDTTLVEDDDDSSSRALPYLKAPEVSAAAPVLEVPRPPSTTGQDSFLLWPDELREFLEQPDHQPPRSPSSLSLSQVHPGSSQQNSYRQRADSTVPSSSTRQTTPDPTLDEESTATSPLPTLPPRLQPQAHRKRTSEGGRLREGNNDTADRRGTRNKPQEPDKPTRETPSDAQKLREKFYAAARKVAKKQSPEPEKLVLNRPILDSKGMHAKSFNGNLAIDCLLPGDTIALDYAASGSGNMSEFTHWRFTAVTCPPSNSALLTFRLDPDEDPFDFVDRLHLIRKSIETLQGVLNFTRDPRDPSWSTRFPSDMEAWKHIVVHIHGPRNWEGLDETIAKSLEGMGAKQVLESAVSSLDGQELESPYEEDATTLQGKQVHCTIRECSTRLSPILKSYLSVRTRKLREFTAGIPMQIISTATRGGDSPQDSQRDCEQWTSALGELLKTDLIINMTKFKDSGGEKRFFLWKSLAYAEHLVTRTDSSNAGLKVIDYADLRAQVQEIDKARRKSLKNIRQKGSLSSESGDVVGT